MFIRQTRSLTALLLALILLLAAPAAPAESDEDTGTADIEEALITKEGGDPGSLAENLVMFKNLLQDEDVKAILKNKEVGEITSELVARVLSWMLQNRPVTMKILTELGIRESDRQSIEKIWDSADRIIATYNEYLETEDGKQLAAEFEAVRTDPDIIESVIAFRDLATSEDLTQLLHALSDAVEADKTNDEMEDGRLTQAVMEREISDKNFIGAVILEIMSILDHSEWAQESVPKLAKNENLLRLLEHLANGNQDLDKMIRDELRLILGDQEVKLFIQNVLRDGHALYKTLLASSDQAAEPETNDHENTVEEVAP